MNLSSRWVIGRARWSRVVPPGGVRLEEVSGVPAEGAGAPIARAGALAGSDVAARGAGEPTGASLVLIDRDRVLLKKSKSLGVRKRDSGLIKDDTMGDHDTICVVIKATTSLVIE